MYQSTDEFLSMYFNALRSKENLKVIMNQGNLQIFCRIHRTFSWMKDSLSIFWLKPVAVMKSDLKANNVFIADSEYSSFILLSCTASPGIIVRPNLMSYNS